MKKPVRDTALSFRIPKSMKDEIEQIASDEDRSVSYIVERIIREFLERRGKKE